MSLNSVSAARPGGCSGGPNWPLRSNHEVAPSTRSYGPGMASAPLSASDTPLLLVRLNGQDVCTVAQGDVPCEMKTTVETGPEGFVEFIDPRGLTRRHDLGSHAGWFHVSVRVHENLACQIDCIITKDRAHAPDALPKGEATGIRFQPFFLAGGAAQDEEFRGTGLFNRGLHFSGHVTPGTVLLSCTCDTCRRSFLIHSFHAGFSHVGYFYSGSGKHTLLVGVEVPGCPAPLSEPDAGPLAALEAALPPAPDGTRFRYTNPFRCPHCAAAYIDFEGHPEYRPKEYYGNYFVGSELIYYKPPGA